VLRTYNHSDIIRRVIIVRCPRRFAPPPLALTIKEQFNHHTDMLSISQLPPSTLLPTPQPLSLADTRRLLQYAISWYKLVTNYVFCITSHP
jgi:hypothetical protein